MYLQWFTINNTAMLWYRRTSRHNGCFTFREVSTIYVVDHYYETTIKSLTTSLCLKKYTKQLTLSHPSINYIIKSSIVYILNRSKPHLSGTCYSLYRLYMVILWYTWGKMCPCFVGLVGLFIQIETEKLPVNTFFSPRCEPIRPLLVHCSSVC